jgi:hypothetical protein
MATVVGTMTRAVNIRVLSTFRVLQACL